jgi:hypothetical protein
MITTELELTLDCCRWTFAGGNDVSVAGRRDLDWPRFLRVVQRHRVQALVWNALKGHNMPGPVAEALATDSASIGIANLRAALESKELLASFERAAIPLIFVKGLTVGALAYANPMLKMGWDIDLLVNDNDVVRAADLLRERGYERMAPARGDLRSWHKQRKESVWTRASHDVHVELHSRLSDNPRLLPGLGPDCPRQVVEVSPGIALPTLAKDELFAYLAVHGASSAWFRLKWITDFAALLHRESADEIERLYDRSQQLGAGRAAAQALLLAERIYAIGIGDGLRGRLCADPVNRWLVSVAEGQLKALREPTERFLGTTSIHLSQLFLLPGWRFKASESARQLKDIVGAEGR